MLVYLNGEFLPHTDACVSVDDRGFLFADGVYEVARIYEGKILLLDAHLRRMREGLGALQISDENVDRIPDIAERLLDENGLRTGDSTLYVQVSRGVAPRKHAFPPAGTASTLYVAVRPITPPPATYFDDGVAAITVADTRWSRCDIKSIALLPNVLANQQAHAAGAFEALFVRDGVVIEGSHSNLLAVYDGTIVTYPACNYILAGITRGVVVDELAPELGIPVRQGPILAERLLEADELFLSGTTTEVMPVVRVDGRAIGDGTPGPVTRALHAAYRARV